MAEVGLVLHQHRPELRELADRTTEWLLANGHAVRVTAEDAALVPTAGVVDDGDFGRGLDLVVSLGGDGTMLRTVRLVADDDVDILGVNAGRLGYLTEVEPSGLETALDRYVAGDFSVESRMLLSVTTRVPGLGDEGVERALNEAVLEKTSAGHTVRLAVTIDGEYFTTYATDGLIVATPTGSTAYAFSARGPIVDPAHRALLLTPVSPHMLFDRTLVLEPDTTIEITVADHRDATLTIDGRPAGVLHEGESIACRASQHHARLVTFGPREFHRILKAKFGLNDR
ncbi:MAG: NAD(+)/NADH kinase [Acidimicrobiales bacterium]